MRTLVVLLLFFATVAAAQEAEPAGFRWRGVGLGGELPSDEVQAHLDFSFSHGFNAVAVPGPQAGRWSAREAPEGPLLDPAFVDWAHRCAVRGIRILVVVNPVIDGGGTYVFNDPENLKRIRRFLKLLRRQADIHDFVISFRDAPLRVEELTDTILYGPVAAPLHVDLVRGLLRKLPSGDRLWFQPAIASTTGMTEGSIPYSAALVARVSALDPGVGFVWYGPRPISPTVRVADLDALLEVIGPRPVILNDRFPSGLGGPRLSLAISLAAVQGREPALRSRLSAYLAEPAAELAGSRLSLLTVADFLRSPESYDPRSSQRNAVTRLAGADRPATHAALTTQAMEWGGWIDERNYRSPLRDNPRAAAEILADPAAVASWSWVERRYPERMQELGAIPDERFRDDLLAVMSTRLTIALAMPSARALKSRLASGREDTESMVRQLRTLRQAVETQPRNTLALDRFLEAAGIRDQVVTPPAR
jgi:hypothetical protein